MLAGARYDRAITHSNAYDGNGEQLGNNSQRVTPRFGLLWRPIEEVSLYGSYLENFGSAGGVSGPAGPTQQILPSETAQQWEVGVKTELFDKRLTATLAYYNLIKQHVGVSDPDPTRAALGYRVATGEIRNRGVELDVAGEILPGWKVIGGYSYIDSIVAKDEGVVSDPLGNTVSFKGFTGFIPADVSRHMGNLFTTYELQDGDWKGLKFGGGVNARSKSYGDSLNSYHVPGYAIFNLLASYSWSLYGDQADRAAQCRKSGGHALLPHRQHEASSRSASERREHSRAPSAWSSDDVSRLLGAGSSLGGLGDGGISRHRRADRQRAGVSRGTGRLAQPGADDRRAA